MTTTETPTHPCPTCSKPVQDDYSPLYTRGMCDACLDALDPFRPCPRCSDGVVHEDDDRDVCGACFTDTAKCRRCGHDNGTTLVDVRECDCWCHETWKRFGPDSFPISPPAGKSLVPTPAGPSDVVDANGWPDDPDDDDDPVVILHPTPWTPDDGEF
jgi:hypothetical protein